MPASRVARLLILLCLMVPSAMAQGNSPAAPAIAEPDSDRDDPAARDQWFMQGRVAPKGTNAADLRWKAYQQKIQLSLIHI